MNQESFKLVGQTKLSNDGRVELKVRITTDQEVPIVTSFLVTSDQLQHPILGTNAIENLTVPYSKTLLVTAPRFALPDQES